MRLSSSKWVIDWFIRIKTTLTTDFNCFRINGGIEILHHYEESNFDLTWSI